MDTFHLKSNYCSVIPLYIFCKKRNLLGNDEENVSCIIIYHRNAVLFELEVNESSRLCLTENAYSIGVNKVRCFLITLEEFEYMFTLHYFGLRNKYC